MLLVINNMFNIQWLQHNRCSKKCLLSERRLDFQHLEALVGSCGHLEASWRRLGTLLGGMLAPWRP